MTCGDLITLLSSQLPDRTVLVDGYEGGYDDIACTLELEVVEITEATECARCFTEAYVDAGELPDVPSRRVMVLGRPGKQRRG